MIKVYAINSQPTTKMTIRKVIANESVTKKKIRLKKKQNSVS